jgi:UDP-N-acetylglucosamine 2-epimerase (non-hydrolysing)
MYEVIQFYRKKIDASNILSQLNLHRHQYFLFSSHREENIESIDNLDKIFLVMNSLAEKYHLPVIVSTHPRMRKYLEVNSRSFNPLVRFHKPFGFLDYIALQMSARVVLSDSGTITEESSILNFPALNLRDVQERPEGFEEASVMFVGLNLNRILQALKILENQGRDSVRMLEIVRDYKVLNLSEKILRIILSYTNLVDQKIWRRYQV